MKTNNGFSWKKRSREDGWQNKISQTVKNQYREGKLVNPMLGKKRPDLAERNRKGRKYTEELILKLFDDYKVYEGGLRGFAKLHNLDSRQFRLALHLYISPEKLEPVLESKKGNNEKYRLGRSFEYRVRDFYKKQGYFVIRSPQSRGPMDLVAIKKGVVLFIQCKINGYMQSKEKNALIVLATSCGAKPLLAWRRMEHHYPIQIEVLVNKTIDLEAT
jgi:Holliday junction resolvase